MIEGKHQINILLLVNFILGVISAYSLSFLPLLITFSLLYFSPRILSFLGLLDLKNYKTQQLLKIRITTFVFGAIDYLCLGYPNLFSVYLCILTVYHMGEFQLINLYHHADVKWSCFLIYHSKEYSIANAVCMLEHVLTTIIFKCEYKRYSFVTPFAFTFMMAGLVMRLMAFFTAKSNFTHLVQSQRRPKHQLVTNGIYKYIRHPGYLGFFIFSVSSMLFIKNYFCFVAYFFVLRGFFKERMEYEEYTLMHFFPEYEAYRQKTPHWMPFTLGNKFQQQL